jgi:hypothetical protein
MFYLSAAYAGPGLSHKIQRVSSADQVFSIKQYIKSIEPACFPDKAYVSPGSKPKFNLLCFPSLLFIMQTPTNSIQLPLIK